MRRFTLSTLIALFALFALFCCMLSARAVASSGMYPPTVTGGSSPLIGTELTAALASGAPTGDTLAWETCDASSDAEGNSLGSGSTYTLAVSDTDTYVCAVELSSTLTVDGVSDPIGPVSGPPVTGGPTLSSSGGVLSEGQSVTEGETLTVNQANWVDSDSITDVWEDCDSYGYCAEVAEGSSYQLARGDVGYSIEVVETATAANGASASAATPATGSVSATAPSVDPSNPPNVTGTPQVGQLLKVSTGSWSNDPTSYTFQWERCSTETCTEINGATNSSYTPVNADVGDSLIALVTGVVDGVDGVAYPSYPTSAVVGVNAPTPTTTTSPTDPVVPVTSTKTPKLVGRLTATMLWTFRYAPSFTQIMALAVEGPALDSTITTRCSGKGCPFPVHRVRVRKLKRCRAKATGACGAPREVNLEWEFDGHSLHVGSRITITIRRARDVGKYYRFIIRRRRAPSVMISCLAPGSNKPGKSCTGL